MNDPVNHPSHYTSGAVECIDAIEAAMTFEEFVGFLRGQMIKYVWRAGRKGDGREDIEKALWYGRKLADRLTDTRLAPPECPSAWASLAVMAEAATRREASDAASGGREAAEGSTVVDYDKLSTLEDTAGNLLLAHTDYVDWSEAPEWAMFLAFDDARPGGENEHRAYWFERRPEWRQTSGYWASGGQGGRIMLAQAYSGGCGDPRLFLRTRP